MSLALRPMALAALLAGTVLLVLASALAGGVAIALAGGVLLLAGGGAYLLTTNRYALAAAVAGALLAAMAPLEAPLSLGTRLLLAGGVALLVAAYELAHLHHRFPLTGDGPEERQALRATRSQLLIVLAGTAGLLLGVAALPVLAAPVLPDGLAGSVELDGPLGLAWTGGLVTALLLAVAQWRRLRIGRTGVVTGGDGGP